VRHPEPGVAATKMTGGNKMRRSTEGGLVLLLQR
jgi:hypothetical protein